MIHFHKWSKWEISEKVVTVSMFDPKRKAVVQERRCQTCGLYQTKAL